MKRPPAVRYAVVGLGYFAQAAVLPAFARLRNSKLVALFSADAKKLQKLGAQYKITHRLDYSDYDEFLKSGEVDAVYIALPNNLHAEYSIRASQANVHVLCEKPMAVTEEECSRMIAAARDSGTQLMVAYRLHFESATLTLIDAIRAGKLGNPRLFDAAFTMQVQDSNIRVRRATLGGGPLYDIGIYCINAARSVFQDEPIAVTAVTARNPDDARFREVEEQIAAVLKFPGERLATFTAGFGAHAVSRFQVIGSKGLARLDPAFEYAEGLKLEMQLGKRMSRRSFKKRDQIASEILYFSDCIIREHKPEPSGAEGLADIRVIEALHRSAAAGRTVELAPVGKSERPNATLETFVAPHGMPELVHASAPSR
ncbi:MAG TPA: Gfo/Idh/MocA family oxidoreductase [Polyangiales bacterium]|nr:Gfo/Idh/MocA family oxidoreductase [Polyangiales bacterium]